MLATIASAASSIAELTRIPLDRQRALGCHHTLREIDHQPDTWRSTARALEAERPRVRALVDATIEARESATILLTGSGSSSHLATCVAASLQHRTGATVRSVPCGDLLTDPWAFVPRTAPCLVVSFGRSGDSPESAAVVERLLDVRHVNQLVITCNAAGRLATEFAGRPRLECVVLDDRTNDRSLVMTSGFTNMLIAGWLLLGAEPNRLEEVDRVATAAEIVMARSAVPLRQAVGSGARRVVFLGTGPNLGAALESGLKMLEMTAGRVSTLVDTFLGVRHGPMAAIDDGTLVVAFLSSDATSRAYEEEVVQEIGRKSIGRGCVLVGQRLDPEWTAARDEGVVWVDVPAVHHELICLVHVVVGQWLAFWRCALEGLRPDEPSGADVITRVVPPFRVHPMPGRS